MVFSETKTTRSTHAFFEKPSRRSSVFLATLSRSSISLHKQTHGQGNASVRNADAPNQHALPCTPNALGIVAGNLGQVPYARMVSGIDVNASVNEP